MTRVLVHRQADFFPCIVTCDQPTVDLAFRSTGSSDSACLAMRHAVERAGYDTHRWPDSPYVNPDYARDHPEICRWAASIPELGSQAGAIAVAYTPATYRADELRSEWLAPLSPWRRGDILAVLTISKGPD
jgi:hypothetical protein